MARYSSQVAKATLSTTVGAFALEAPGASMRRFKLYDMMLGFSSAGDVQAIWRPTRTSTASTGTGKTEAPLDPADAAAVTTSKDEVTVEGTLGDVLGDIPNNQRATVRWVPQPGGEIVVPATAAAGILVRTPVLSGGTPGGNGTLWFEEQ